METYILFFGKSQSFRFEAYDVNGPVYDFSSVIPDFEDLESRTVVVNKIDNLPVYAHYKIKAGTKLFTLFKVYKCAQAFDGNRIEGSICGVAFLSEGNLNIDVINIKSLNLLFKSFNDLALSNSKFKQANFKPITDSIWKAFIEQITYDNISIGTSEISFSSPSTVAIGLNSISDIHQLLQSSIVKSQRVYFSEDKELLRSSFLRWEDRLELYFFENGKLKLFAKNPNKNILVQQKTVKEVNDDSRTKIFELEVALKQEKKIFKEEILKWRGKNRLLIILVVILFFLNIGYFFYNEFWVTKLSPISPTTSSAIGGVPKESGSDSLQEFEIGTESKVVESYISGEVFQDTSSIKDIQSMLTTYLNLSRMDNKRDSLKFTKLKNEFYRKVSKINTLDSVELESIIFKK